ncbi:MAG: HDOD domain-containing protein [Magnetococcales bacterium]|nr:HDOD domain-containing protein [Magnetococcales bacterium]NGZ26871.1 HDOD domain-containing protein [Magnetococcales bacterium]
MAKKPDIKGTRKLVKDMAIPTRPTVMLEVIKAQNTFAPDLQKVANVISRDVVLASRVLQAANSDLPGLKRRVASIEQAVMLLGLARIRTLITGVFLNTSLIGKGGSLQKLRHRCADVARVTAFIAQELPRLATPFQSGYLPSIPPDEAYALGLFHDCGLSILMQKFSDYESFYEEIQKESPFGLVSAEDERYHTNHCVVGYLLCESWNLPKHLCEVIRNHHHMVDFTKPGKKSANRRTMTLHGILKLAEQITGELSYVEWVRMKDDLFRFFNIGDSQVAQLQEGASRLLQTPSVTE